MLPDLDIDAIRRPYLNRDLSADDLEELRRRLTLAYVERGFVTSGVVLPEQDVANGVLTYSAIEGHASAVEVTGTYWLRPSYVSSRLARAAGDPININDLRNGVQLLQEDPNIQQINVNLHPGVEQGDSRIDAVVKETRVWSISTSIANDEPPDVGAIHGQLAGSLRNLIGVGDTLALGYGRTSGANFGDVGWSVPFTGYDTTLNVGWSYNGAGVVSDAFRGLDIRSIVQVASVSVSQPIHLALSQTLTAAIGYEFTINNEFLLGEPFSFSPGYVDGHAQASAIFITVDWLDRTPTSVLALRSTVRQGLHVFGATGASGGPNANYVSWLGQAQYTQTIFRRAEVTARLYVQLATAPLYPFQQIAIGGPATVRGYVQDAIVRDNGMIGSLEGRIPLTNFKLPFIGADGSDGALNLVPFVDGGGGWNSGNPTPTPGAIGSIGIGLQWDITQTMSAGVYYGYPLTRPHQSIPFYQPIIFAVTARL